MALSDDWYARRRWLLALRPLSCLFTAVARSRFKRLRVLGSAAAGVPVPVIIVGNITVGGTGKTPMVIALIELLRRAGYRPGVVSRGYGACPSRYPFHVTASTSPSEGGDEPCLIVQRTGAALVIDPDRMSAVRSLLSEHDCDVIISDDGLQHYALPRDLEIAVVDAARGLGNGRCLPEGPLREPPERLQFVDWVVCNGDGDPPGLPLSLPARVSMQLKPVGLVSLEDGRQVSCRAELPGCRVHALAGIGNPSRFFDTLRQLGFDPIEHPLADHADVPEALLALADEYPVIMTEKDAVKCRHLGPRGCWALRVDADLGAAFDTQLLQRLAPWPPHQTGQNNGPETA
ncbi:tetraacyldisaccharide 4'-kinase [Marinobacterium weihaiense]|nr:tetraacyldisaccharide 4'-kinase [Marinobacterium weihaiense]